MAINNELSEQIEKLVWTVMYANCTDELRRKLSSLKESEVKEAVREIVEECSNNPKIKEEINHLMAKVLIDLNNEV